MSLQPSYLKYTGVYVTAAEVVGSGLVEVGFSDGAAGVIDLSSELIGVPHSELADPELFAETSVDKDSGTIVWPNGADFAPGRLRELLEQQNETQALTFATIYP